MQQVYIPMTQCWETLDDAIVYFLGIVQDLKVLQQLSDPPTDLYLSIEQVSEVDPSDREIILRSL